MFLNKYGTHERESDAAPSPAWRRIDGDLLDIHAGWRCESTKNRHFRQGLS